MKFFPCVRTINKAKWKVFLAVRGMRRTPANVVSKWNQSKEMRGSGIGRIWLYFCEWTATLPAKTSPRSPGELRWDGPGLLRTLSCLACPIASNTCGGLGGFVWVVWYYHSVIVAQYSSLLTSAEVFQAWWRTPARYGEEIQAAVVPGTQGLVEKCEKMREGLEVFSYGG